MALLLPDESEQMLRSEDQTTTQSLWSKTQVGSRLCFKVLALGVALLLCVVATLRVGNGIKTHHTGVTAMWEEFSQPGSGSLNQYRRKISKDMNYDDQLVSWDTVMCHAIQEDRGGLVRALAYRYPNTLHAQCSSYHSPLEFAIEQHPRMVEVLLRARAPVSRRIMVQAACHEHQDSFWSQQMSQQSQNYGFGEFTGSSRLLMMLLRLGNGNPNAHYNGQSPLNCAATHCDISEVNLLMRAGAYINSQDGQGMTPLLNSLAGGCDSLAQEFIQNGADIMVETSTGENALQVACQKCMANAAQDLLEKGINVDHKDNQGRTALDSAALHGCVPIASALLDNPFTNVNEEDNSGQTALFMAIQGNGPETLISMFIEKGADVNHQDQNGQTPLMMAAKAGKDCQLLLQHGADVAKVDKAGNTALWYAASAGSATAATSLLQGGAGSLINQKGEAGKTPFAIACWNTHPEVAQVLMAHGADAKITDNYEQLPLSLATQFTMHLNPSQNPVRTPQSISTVDQWTARQQKLLGVLKVLVDAKVDLNIYDFEGFTPLLNMLRFQKNQWGVPAQAAAFSQAAQANANFLVEHGANPNMASKNGWFVTPLAFCAYNGYPSTAALLLQRGANRWAQNAAGKTPAQLCGGGPGQLEVAQLLR